MTHPQTQSALAAERTTSASERRWPALSQNAYRVLGLPADATQKEIYEAAASLRRALKLGVTKRTACDALWLGSVERNENALRDAEGRLARPAQRSFERLSWFHEAASIVELESLAALDPALSELLARRHAKARHDAALLASAACLRFDAEMRAATDWERAFTLWRKVIEGEEFWPLLLATDLRGDFEQLVSHAEIRDLRQRAWRLVTAPVVELAKDSVLEKNEARCSRAMALLRAAQLPQRLLTEYENEVFAIIEDEFENQCQEIFITLTRQMLQSRSRGERLQRCNETLRLFKDRVRPRLRKIREMAGDESRVTHRSCETAARHLLQLALAYLVSESREEGSQLLSKAYALAPPASETAILIEESLREHQLAEKIVERSEEQYCAELAWHLRPQTELFASYEIEAEASTPTPTPTTTEGGCLTLLLEILVPVMVLVLCGFCFGGKSRRRTSPPPYNYWHNQNLRPPAMPPLNLNIELPPPVPPPTIISRADGGASSRRGKERGREKRRRVRRNSSGASETGTKPQP